MCRRPHVSSVTSLVVPHDGRRAIPKDDLQLVDSVARRPRRADSNEQDSAIVPHDLRSHAREVARDMWSPVEALPHDPDGRESALNRRADFSDDLEGIHPNRLLNLIRAVRCVVEEAGTSSDEADQAVRGHLAHIR